MKSIILSAPLGSSFLRLSLLLLTVLFCSIAGFVLDGSPSAFAQFPRWRPGLNGTLSLRFRTREPNGLLIYTDDRTTADFFELKLVEGCARLRFNLGGGTAILTAGRNLHDSQWHALQMTRNAEETLLVVDEETQRRLTPGPDYAFGNASSPGTVFAGGLPAWLGGRLGLLALPSAYFEPRFKGHIANLTYASDDGITRPQEMQEAKGLRTDNTLQGETSTSDPGLEDHCEKEDPCLNGGRCISTDAGPICDCATTDFEGDLCEQKRPPSEATFTGSEHLSFDLGGRGGEPLVSWSDRVSLHFRTRQSTGTLLLLSSSASSSQEGGDFLHVALKGGAITVATRLGTGLVERAIRPARTRFDDNQWHKIVIHRKVREITRATGFCHLSVTVDGVYTDRGSTAGAFSSLASSSLSVGGAGPAEAAILPAARLTNHFVGCVRKVEYVADSVSLDLLALAKSQSPLLVHHGDVQFFCQEAEAADPITFTTREAFLALPTWEGSRTGTIGFKFRTNEATGLLMYNGGASSSPQSSSSSSSASSSGDVFGLELLDGHVYLVLGLGSEVSRVKASAKRCDDGLWHALSLRRTGKSGRVAVDEAAFDFTTLGSASQLDLEGPLFAGGLGGPEQGSSAPPELWSAKLRQGFVGCLRHLAVNGRAVDLAAHAREQDSGSLRPSCHASPLQCESRPCLNGGACAEGWNRFLCDCTRTGFTGPVCAKEASTLSFDGSQFLRVPITEGSRTQAEDVVLRFRTPRPGGLLMATGSDKAHTFLALGLETGRLKLILNLGNKNKVIHFGQSLNDDTWHTVHLRRRGKKMDIHVDSESKSYDLGEESITLDVQVLYAGAVHPEGQRPVKDFPNFVGHMQHLVFNSKHYLDMAHSGQLANFKVTAKFGKKENAVHHPVTFKSKYTFLGLPQLRAYNSLNLYLQFKTLEPNGLLLYNAGKGRDFVALELVNGHLHLAFDLGDGPRGAKSNTRSALNDNLWHAVTVGRPSPHQHTLMVDDMITKVSSPGPNTHLDLSGLLYVGGVRRSMYGALPRLVHSRQGFQGCLASLDLNGESADLVRDALIPSTLVALGCAGPITKCSHSACVNHGVCVQMWNSYACDCDMTSFSGPICADESISYEFGPGTGLITFTYPADKRPDTKTDLVTLGFITMADNGVLARIDSGSSNDYMELEIVDGNVLMVYNMGTEDHPIGEHSVRVNDGQYHVVRFTRSGPNSTIQVDEHNVRAKLPPGRQLMVFNSHSTVQVGGKLNVLRGGVERAFQGIVSGMVVNGDRVLDMAAEDDPRVAVEGDVELLMSLPLSLQQRSLPPPPHHQMQQSSGASPGYEGDDLVYSGGGGAGSGCWDDEDDCGEMEPTSGDDLITPVYIPPTPKPQPRTTPEPNAVGGAGWSGPGRSPGPRGGLEDTTCDDEEECAEGGSGLGELAFSAPPPPAVPLPGVSPPVTSVTPPPPSPPSLAPPTPITPPSNRPRPPNHAQQPGTANGTPQHETDNTEGGATTVQRRPPPPPVHPQPPQGSGHGRDSHGAPTPRSPPAVYGVPIPEMPVTGRERERPPPRAKSSADNTAMVIGIIAGVLIVVVIVALVVYRVRSWTAAGGYKADESSVDRKHAPPFQPPTAPPHMNGAPPPAKPPKQQKKKDVKDLKEWYV